jgi:hypothetical protein
MRDGVALVIMINPIPHHPESSAMNATMTLTAWLCILSTALLGCTSTTLYKPEGENQEKLHSGQIEGVVMKDGSKFEFDGDKKATIADGMVRWTSEGKAVTIRLSDVDKVLVRESDTGLTIEVVVGGVLAVAAVGFILLVARDVGGAVAVGQSGLFGK